MTAAPQASACKSVVQRGWHWLESVVSGIRANAIPCPECYRHGLHLMYEMEAYAHRKEDLLRYVACHYCRTQLIINAANR